MLIALVEENSRRNQKRATRQSLKCYPNPSGVFPSNNMQMFEMKKVLVNAKKTIAESLESSRGSVLLN